MKSPFLVLKKDCGEAVQWISDQLSQSGLQVVQTFDLQTASFVQSGCSCPHHGTEQCDCQMVVLLVYENGFPPASVIAHGHNGQTWFTLVDPPSESTPPGSNTAIQDTVFALSLQTLRNAF